MVTTIINKYFASSPLAARIEIGDPGTEGERPFELALTSDKDKVVPVTACKGTLFSNDISYLCTGLDRLARGELDTFRFAPLEPSFLLRAHLESEGSVELLWVVDQGMAENDFSTDTGIGVLMIVDAAVLASASNDLSTC